MFDKLYKEANDEIRVNTQLLEELKSEASKGKKQKTYSFMYKYGFAAAAILIMVVSLNVMPDIKKSQESEKRYPGSQEQIVKTEKNASHNEASESLTKEETKSFEDNQNSEEMTKDDFTSKKNGINDTKITTPPKKVQSEKNYTTSPQTVSNKEKDNITETPTKTSDDINKTDDKERTVENTVIEEDSVKVKQSDSEQKENSTKKEETANNSSPKNIETEKNDSKLVEKDVKKENTVEQKDSDNIIKTKTRQVENIVENENTVNTSSDNTITTQSMVEASDTDNTETESFSAIPEDYENIPLSRSIDVDTSIPTTSTSVNISLEEYCSTFGFNPDNWAIPSGMIKTDGEEVYIDQASTTGEYLKTNHTVIYSGNGKSIYITLVPDSDDVLSLINSGNGEMYNGNLILINTDLSYTSYIVKNGNGYIVETNNIEKENVYSLIDSIG